MKTGVRLDSVEIVGVLCGPCSWELIHSAVRMSLCASRTWGGGPPHFLASQYPSLSPASLAEARLQGCLILMDFPQEKMPFALSAPWDNLKSSFKTLPEPPLMLIELISVPTSTPPVTLLLTVLVDAHFILPYGW